MPRPSGSAQREHCGPAQPGDRAGGIPDSDILGPGQRDRARRADRRDELGEQSCTMPRHVAGARVARGHALRQSARMFVNGGAPGGAASPNASWSFSLGPFIVPGRPDHIVYVRRWRACDASVGAPRCCSSSGIAFAVIALFSPVDSLGEDLFLMHMVQHILLLDIVPILCILGLTRSCCAPSHARCCSSSASSGPIASPVFAITLYVGAMWAWHIPALYDLALEHPLVHILEHTFFTAAGALYWWHILSPIRNGHLAGMGPVVYMIDDEAARRACSASR